MWEVEEEKGEDDSQIKETKKSISYSKKKNETFLPKVFAHCVARRREAMISWLIFDEPRNGRFYIGTPMVLITKIVDQTFKYSSRLY